MTLLIDSNVLVWWMNDHPRLKKLAREAIGRSPAVFVSLVTPWELWIKAAKSGVRFPEISRASLQSEGFTLLGMELEDARLAAALPLLHRDPFDRMIVAQAMNRRATLVTSDRALSAYGADTMLV